MSLYDRTMDAWRELDGPWRACLELAWQAYLAETIPVGSVVTDPTGAIVARGRNRIFEAPGTGLAGSRLAHAEVEALAALATSTRYADHTLVSSLEPCLLCVGAALLSTVGSIAYAAVDPFGGACSASFDFPDWTRRPLKIAGPLEGWPAFLSAALQSAYWQGRGDSDTAPDIVDAFGEDARGAGRRVRELRGLSEQLEEALPRLLECL
jgi:tRNA(Arg) A34 adenosine deaminase TadA